MRELLTELTTLLDQGRDCVYCSVVETRGSTPQKAGAAMLVFPDGSQTGTLGGGCVEAEVKQRALRVLGGDVARPEVLTFCLDDNYGWDDGLICGGRMTILAQPLTAAGPALDHAASYYRHLHSLADRGAGYTEAVVIGDALGLPVGDRYLFDAAGTLVTHHAERPGGEVISAHLHPLSARPKPGTHRGVAYMPSLPRVALL